MDTFDQIIAEVCAMPEPMRRERVVLLQRQYEAHPCTDASDFGLGECADCRQQGEAISGLLAEYELPAVTPPARYSFADFMAGSPERVAVYEDSYRWRVKYGLPVPTLADLGFAGLDEG